MDDRHSKLLEIISKPADWGSLVRQCQDYAECCGLLIRRQDSEGKLWTSMGSMMLLPTKYPLSAYNEALAVQHVYNELYLRVAHNHEFMKETLASAFDGDDFVRKLWDIYETVRQEGSGNPISLDIVRSDYMYQLKNGKFSIAQIEYNTIASSMGVLSEKVNQTHRHLGRVLKDTKLIDPSKLPECTCVSMMADGMVKAWQLYGKPMAVVLVVIEVEPLNFSDIRHIEYEILKQSREIKVVFIDTDSLLNSTLLTDDGRLIVEGNEVAVVYLRVFYKPEQYDEKHWQLRLLMERSKAIKCPSIRSHLSGTKMIQQSLTTPGVLEQFLSADKCAQVRKSFVGISTLTQDAVDEAKKHPDDYVLKPNREGGGNNYYGSDIISKLNEISTTAEKDAYILMERVYPPSQYNCTVSSSQGSQAVCKCQPVISELGIYGTIIGTSTEILHNTVGGYLLRSKSTESNEGGFYTGHSSLDTPYLLEDHEMVEEINSPSTNQPCTCCA